MPSMPRKINCCSTDSRLLLRWLFVERAKRHAQHAHSLGRKFFVRFCDPPLPVVVHRFRLAFVPDILAHIENAIDRSLRKGNVVTIQFE